MKSAKVVVPPKNSAETESEIKKRTILKNSETTETYVIIPPDGGWGWCVVFGAFCSYFISDGLLYSFGLFLKDISITFNCSQSQASMAGAISTCFFCISGPFSAALVNRFGYRTVSIIGSVIASMACILTSISNSIYLVIVFYGVIGGIGFGMIYITAVIVVGFYFDRWRALATGFAVCGAGIGGMALPPLFTMLIEKLGWQQTFMVLAGMVSCIIFCALIFKQISPTRVLIAKTASNKIIEIKNVNKYHNITYPTLVDGIVSNVTILESTKMQKNDSTVIGVTEYQDSSPNMSYKSNLISDVPLTYEHSIIFEESELVNTKRCRKCRKCCNINCCTCCNRRKRGPKFTARPLYRDDIFFSGSVMTLPQYQKAQGASVSTKSKSVVEYNISVTRSFAPEESHDKNTCSLPMKRTLATMLDFHLLKSPLFVLLIFNGVFTSFGFYTPYMFVKDRGVQHKVPTDMAIWFISTMGLTNTFGRICCGILSSIPGVKAIVLGYILLFIGGLATILSTISYVIWVQFLFCAVYGFAMSSMSALRTIIVVEMLGLEKLTNAIGMILMFQGLATLAGISISGWLRDITGDYYFSFYFGGICICIGALFLFSIHILTILKH